MKTVQNIKSKEIRRMSDEIAEKMVDTNQWKFISKKTWKGLKDENSKK